MESTLGKDFAVRNRRHKGFLELLKALPVHFGPLTSGKRKIKRKVLQGKTYLSLRLRQR